MSYANPSIAAYFESMDKSTATALNTLRNQILDTAQKDAAIGQVEETLKWGMPSYATLKPRSGTPLRLSAVSDKPGVCALSVHCQSTLIADFKEVYPALDYDTNRSLLVPHADVASDEVRHFIWLALTYHQRRKKGVGV